MRGDDKKVLVLSNEFLKNFPIYFLENFRIYTLKKREKDHDAFFKYEVCYKDMNAGVPITEKELKNFFVIIEDDH